MKAFQGDFSCTGSGERENDTGSADLESWPVSKQFIASTGKLWLQKHSHRTEKKKQNPQTNNTPERLTGRYEISFVIKEPQPSEIN